jgi:hypothetical protein
MRNFLLLIVLAGCSNSTRASDVPDLGDENDLALAADLALLADLAPPFVPVSPPPLAQVPNHGGPVVASPHIITLSWQGDPIGANFEAFDDWMVTSSFWKATMVEWGVGPGVHAASYRAPSPAPSTLDEVAIDNLITTAAASGLIPSPSPSNIYTVYPPSGTTVTELGAYTGCVDFQGYHSITPSGAIFAVAPRCSNTSGLSATDYITWGMSHEVMEASSDPDASHPAWVITTQTPSTPLLGETADLCEGQPVTIEGHLVTRNYSNVAAIQGQRPCVPAPPGPMFGAFANPVAISLAAGTKMQLVLTLYSTAPTKPFTIIPIPRSSNLTVSVSPKSGQNGDSVTLTVTASANYIDQPQLNLIDLFAALPNDYTTQHELIVH